MQSLETETRPETFKTDTSKTGLETHLETETKSRDSINDTCLFECSSWESPAYNILSQMDLKLP